MASGARRIEVQFLGKDVSAGKTANAVEGKYSKLGARMNKVGNIAGKALAGGLLLAGAAAVKAGRAAAEDEAAQAKLAQTLKTAAGASTSQIASTESWITAQGKALGVTDDELRPALGKLAVATKDVGDAQKYASLAMDISAGSGKSLDAVTTALQKGINGSVGGLSRLGVATKNADGSTKSLDQITKELAKTYNGAAAKAADTTAGKQRKLQVQFGELQEEIGAKLLPVFAKLADWGLKTIDWMDKNQKLVGILVGVFGGLVAAVWAINAAARAYTAVQMALNLVMSANPIGLVVLAIAGLVAGLILAYKKSETFRDIVDGAFRKIGAAGKWLWENALRPYFRFIINLWMTVVGALVHGAATAFGWVPGLGPKLKAAARNFDDFKDRVNAQLDGIKDKKIKITTPGANNAISNLSTIRALMYDISHSKQAHPVKSGGSLETLLSPGNNARGTNNWRGGRTWLHEQGPEIVDLPRGTRIIPAGLSRRMAGQGGGGTNVTLNFHGVTTDPVGVGREVRKALLALEQATGKPILAH